MPSDDAPPSIVLPSPLTSSQFRDALARHIDSSKPDPLARRQIEKLRLNWVNDDDRRPPRDRRGDEGRRRPDDERSTQRQRSTITTTTKTLMNRPDHAADPYDDESWERVCGGTLALSSEHITVAIVVDCNFRTTTMTTTTTTMRDRNILEAADMCPVDGVISGGDGGAKATTRLDRTVGGGMKCPTSVTDNNNNTWSTMAEESDKKAFEDEFYFRLAVYAYFASASSGANDGDDGVPRTSSGNASERRRGRATASRLRSGMTERLRSDPSVKLLLVDDMGIEGTTTGSGRSGDGRRMDGITLCEALIQRGDRDRELEERVNVNEDALDGIRNAILSQTEDILDVLDLLLNMPYLPRLLVFEGRGDDREADTSEVLDGTMATATAMATLRKLAQRAYLRLLEDAMFDACEREGEDELLDDLNIS
ncbi:hypothetical protein ACHAXA_006257 [Cyclostephanos tholiformis]|uniref:Uncharacterized protein n=1 Tax=Cyclostephanos tholiformis TaxID=382380 RepID=A0ABD3SNT5_9STRA